ncbi:hypothetical protein ACP_0510 [Acidobacterium capsulatum ATCC 51196]|uniref:Uncharacterized protein n=1 Tax=Acidobacterium capsulatum (strain ATCC 51196 / DSM 11244 / BCRC 80197 / JCM 7670 / NBRC 15755 / NCIMB 13165 / 161) TaxID=240015 RepID=C1F109_ACIC5|nr:hypothetical protein ACP_0510 [Acidobacterium capsulatum ATCC 51196]
MNTHSHSSRAAFVILQAIDPAALTAHKSALRRHSRKIMRIRIHILIPAQQTP